ncbi:MAG: hypothetical protein AAGC44_10845 [Planctomycetota bacterium]
MQRASICVYALLSLAVTGGVSAQTVLNNAIVITEFFDNFGLVDPSGPSAAPLLLSPSNPFGTPGLPDQLLLESSGNLVFTDFAQVRRLDPLTGVISDLAMPSSASLIGLAMEADGTILATDPGALYRINPTSGLVTEIPNAEAFYGPGDLTVAGNGDIYLLEFFQDLLRVDPVTLAFTPVAVDRNYTNASLIEALPNGDLVIVDSQRDVYVFDPDTHTSTQVPIDLGTSVPRGSAIGTSGQFLLATNQALLEIDLTTGASVTLTPDETFFAPYDAVQGTITVPEPASATVLLGGLVMLNRRRR